MVKFNIFTIEHKKMVGNKLTYYGVNLWVFNVCFCNAFVFWLRWMRKYLVLEECVVPLCM